MSNPMFEAMDPYGEIDPKELEDDTEVDSTNVDEPIVGTEDIKAIMTKGSTDATVAHPAGPVTTNFAIRTNDNVKFRVYFTSSFYANPQAINSLCRFLDSRTANQEVTFCLGVDMDGGNGQSQLINPILSAINSCAAKVTGICMGMCGFSETMIWCYCTAREMYRYGALTFLRPPALEVIKELKDYYDGFYDHVIELGILTTEERERIFTKNDTVIKFSSMLQA